MLNLLLAISIVSKVLIVNVTNGTDPKKPVDNLTVSVVGFDEKNNIKFSKAFNPRKGRIVVKNADGTLFYQAETSYENVRYLTEVGKFEGDTLVLELPVFEVTDDDQNIALTNYHMVIFPNDRGPGYYVVEALNISNTGSKTFDAQYYVYFYLPPETDSITYIQPRNEEDWVVVGDTVFYNNVVYPGDQTIAFNYISTLPEVSLYREFPKKLSSAQIFTAPGVKIKSKMFKKEGEQTINGQTYIVYHLVKPADRFSVEIEKGSTGKSTVKLPIAIGVAVLVLLVIVFVRIRSVRSGAGVTGEKGDLLDELKKLVELREKGIISREEFEKAKKRICDKL